VLVFVFVFVLVLVLPLAADPVRVGETPFPVVVSNPFAFAAEIVYTWPSPPFVYVKTAPLAGEVIDPPRFDSVAVPLAGRLSGA
jgi:hypothetical protein